MKIIDVTTLDRLRRRAAQCRRLASQAYSDGIARELETLARDYEENAAELEGAGVDRRQTAAPLQHWH